MQVQGHEHEHINIDDNNDAEDGTIGTDILKVASSNTQSSENFSADEDSRSSTSTTESTNDLIR